MLLIHKCPVGLWSAPLEKLQLLASTSFLYLLSTDLSRFILWIINSFWNWTMEIFFDIALYLEVDMAVKGGYELKNTFVRVHI